MTAEELAQWMQDRLADQSCVYQDESVDVAIKAGADPLYRENEGGNLVLSKEVLAAFGRLNKDTAVWVRPENVGFRRSLTLDFHRILTHPLCEPEGVTVWISA